MNRTRGMASKWLAVLCASALGTGLFAGLPGAGADAAADADLQAKLQQFEEEAWQARLFQLDDKISIGKSVAKIPDFDVGDDLYLGGFSALVHVPGDPANVFYTSTDRGPNGDIDKAKCAGCKVFPLPTFSPQIVKIELANGSMKVLEQIPLQLPNGAIDPITGTSLISGVSNFPNADKTKLVGNGQPDEVPVGTIQYDEQGNITGYTTLDTDPYALDLEGIAYSPKDDTFWMGEEYRPSLVQVKRDGTIVQRLVPQGEAELFAEATAVPVKDVLPAVFSARNPNRGFESATITPDGKYLYTAIQSPMINPQASKVNANSRAARILKLDLSQNPPAPVGEYLYTLDGVGSDSNYISDMMAKDENHLLIDERDANYAFKRVYEANLTDATQFLGELDNVGAVSDPQLSTLEGAVTQDVHESYTVKPSEGVEVTVTPAKKTLVLDLLSYGYPNSKLEGIFMPNDHTLVAVNDNDFNVGDPDYAQAWMYTLTVPAETSATAVSRNGTIATATTGGEGGTRTITTTLKLGENALLGTVLLKLPEGIAATTADTVAFGGGAARELRESELKEAGAYVVLDGVTLKAGESIQLKLANKTVPAGGSVAPTAYIDSDGPEAAKKLSSSFSVPGTPSNPGPSESAEPSAPAETTQPGSGQVKADASGAVDAESLRAALASGQAVVELSGTTANLPAAALGGGAPSGGVVTLVAEAGSFSLPLKALDLNNLARQLGIDAADLVIRVTVQPVEGSQASVIEGKAAGKGSAVVGTPIEFNVEAVGPDLKAVPVSFGQTYVSRSVFLNQQIDAAHATGAWYDPGSGELRFVPTTFERKDGKTVATFKRNGNSVYVVLQSNRAFDDLAGHWAKADIELLANKGVVDGAAPGRFEPNRSITRAEFAALIARALGLTPSSVPASFKDVAADAWYASDVSTAVGAGLLNGYEDGTFKPAALITRSEMAALIVRASTYAGGSAGVDASRASEILSAYTDADRAGWAKTDLAAAVQAGFMQGVSATKLNPQGLATRAEAAEMLKRFLIAADFINN